MHTSSTCPFAKEVRLVEEFFYIDTGLMSSHEHFGINAPPDQRIELQEAMQCPPLTTKGFMSANLTINDTDPTYLENLSTPASTSGPYIEYNYGSIGFYGNGTFVYSNDSVSFHVHEYVLKERGLNLPNNLCRPSTDTC